MSENYTLVGAQALESYRQTQWIAKLKSICSGVTSVSAHDLYLFEAQLPVDTHVLRELTSIFSCMEPSSGHQPAHPESAYVVWVTPRLGTVSPWSSKATDIVHTAGHTSISRVEKVIRYEIQGVISDKDKPALDAALHDRMTQTVLHDAEQLTSIFGASAARPLVSIPLLKEGKSVLLAVNQRLGLALSADELTYLSDLYLRMGRDPTDVELMMFAQANSEHCRHKIFNSKWVIEGEEQPYTLFNMIKHTYKTHPDGVLSAYKDNAAVITGSRAERLYTQPDHVYRFTETDIPILMKVETHNHPTAIAPFAGAATGAGGELRDEGATGRGAKPKAGLVGFSVSYLHIPGAALPWEGKESRSPLMASALQIMIDGPLGSAAYNNEFGRPSLCGYFRSFECTVNGQRLGYHKPIMIAGGYGNINPEHVQKKAVELGDLIVILGGPSMLIGLGGGAASSQTGGSGDAALDFASVQRDNAELERRAQQVIDACWALDKDNPIVSIHDVGAGGLSNAVPEILHDAGCGGYIRLRDIDSADPALSPMELWCNESQERYVLVIKPSSLSLFSDLCARERAGFAVIGEATDDGRLRVYDVLFDQNAVDLAMSDLFYKPPTLVRDVKRIAVNKPAVLHEKPLEQVLKLILQHPTVGDKSFLITIGDRSVGGLTARDQMVGPWQVPVADVAVTAAGFTTMHGEAMSMGERTPIAVQDAPASGRMAVGEAITNMAAARIRHLSDIKLSANWMAACGMPGMDAQLYDTVSAVGLTLCPELGLCIPVGKDSLSMKATWVEPGVEGAHTVASPVSLIISAFAPVSNCRKTLTPCLQTVNDSRVLLIDLGEGKNRLGGSILMEVLQSSATACPDVDNAALLKQAFDAIQALNEAGLILAYHDRSDGGLWATLCEMCFAGRLGLRCVFTENMGALLDVLANEELGMVIQIDAQQKDKVQAVLETHGLLKHTHDIGSVHTGLSIDIQQGDIHHTFDLLPLQQIWSHTTHEIMRLRDNPVCADAQYENILDASDTGLFADLSFDATCMKVYTHQAQRPKVAILREQGVNGHVEMAAAFTLAGFEAVDVTMQDLISRRVDLANFTGLAACGGFSYGDVLGAGRGWAQSILKHPQLREMFAAFFARKTTFTLGVCNGCQMLSQVSHLIPGAENWPVVLRNTSAQFEARLVMVEIPQSPSLFFGSMAGSRLPVVVSHGEGRIAQSVANPTMRYIDFAGEVTERYPYNPNGSIEGLAGMCSSDGRATILMPHPERCIRTQGLSWHPSTWGEYSPWLEMFLQVRKMI